jgi:hypothetical protein
MPRKPMTIKRVRRAADMLLFSAGTNVEVKRGVRAMRDLIIAGIRIERKYSCPAKSLSRN